MPMHLRWIAVAALFGACRPAPPARPSEPAPIDAASAASNTDAAVAVATSADPEPAPAAPTSLPKNDPRCPSGFLVAEGVKCTGDVTDCAYKEGSCGCNPPRTCGGTAQPPPPGPRPGHWSCFPNNQKLVRLDGCPFVFGEPEIPCKQPGKKCVYPSCSWERRVASCVSGKWTFAVESLGAPPP